MSLRITDPKLVCIDPNVLTNYCVASDQHEATYFLTDSTHYMYSKYAWLISHYYQLISWIRTKHILQIVTNRHNWATFDHLLKCWPIRILQILKANYKIPWKKLTNQSTPLKILTNQKPVDTKSLSPCRARRLAVLEWRGQGDPRNARTDSVWPKSI